MGQAKGIKTRKRFKSGEMRDTETIMSIYRTVDSSKFPVTVQCPSYPQNATPFRKFYCVWLFLVRVHLSDKSVLWSQWSNLLGCAKAVREKSREHGEAWS